MFEMRVPVLKQDFIYVFRSSGPIRPALGVECMSVIHLSPSVAADIKMHGTLYACMSQGKLMKECNIKAHHR